MQAEPIDESLPYDFEQIDAFIEELKKFEGGFVSYENGFEDDYFNLKTLIEEVGLLVLNAEKQAEQISSVIKDSDYDEELRYVRSTKLSYRQYTYKAFFFLAYTIYENRTFQLAKIINEYLDIESPGKVKKNTYLRHHIDYLKKNIPDIEAVEISFRVEKHFPEAHHYGEVRNALSHRLGLGEMKEDFRKWTEITTGIEIQTNEKGESVLVVTKVEFILTYLLKIKVFFNYMTYQAHNYSWLVGWEKRNVPSKTDS